MSRWGEQANLQLKTLIKQSETQVSGYSGYICRILLTWGPESQKEHFSIAAYKLSSVKISDLFPRWVPLLYPKVGPFLHICIAQSWPSRRSLVLVSRQVLRHRSGVEELCPAGFLRRRVVLLSSHLGRRLRQCFMGLLGKAQRSSGLTLLLWAHWGPPVPGPITRHKTTSHIITKTVHHK